MRLYKPSLLEPGSVIEHHYHHRPYATVILAGSYEEAGDAGRFRARPGDVLIHGPFSAHRDRVDSARAMVLDLPLPFSVADEAGVARVADPDRLARLCEQDPRDAVRLLMETIVPTGNQERDLCDLLSVDLRGSTPLDIGGWARRNGRSREHVSREFRRIYGVSPSSYRLEARTRRAWRMIVTSMEDLAGIAAGSHFADQAHMTRSVKRLTGRTPREWRCWSRAGPARP